MSRLIWLLIIILVIALIVLLWWWLGRRRERAGEAVLRSQTPPPQADEGTALARPRSATAAGPGAAPPGVQVAPAVPITPAEAGPSAPEAVAPKADDLKIIEGIGPKIAELLQKAGITTFAQLADSDTTRLYQILQAARLRLADPGTWPEQARLAAQGDWDGLRALQDSLRAGRRD